MEKTYKEGLVSIIIPVKNNISYTKDCIDAVFRNSTGIYYEIIVINNESTDGTTEYLESLRKGDTPEYCTKISVITNEVGQSFAKSNNQGAEIAVGEYYLLLNNDTKVLKNYLKEMMTTMIKSDKNAVVGAKLVYPDFTIQHAGVVTFEKLLNPFHFMQHAHFSHKAVNQEREFSAVTAACTLIKAKVFDEVGGFDERFINNLEDVDLCYRIREKGYKVKYTPKAVIIHYESKTPGRSDHINDSTVLLRERWGNNYIGDAERLYQEFGLKITYDTTNSTFKVDFDMIPTSQLVKEASEYFENENYRAVIRNLSKIYEITPERCAEMVYVYLALSYENTGDIDSAMEVVDKLEAHYKTQLSKKIVARFRKLYPLKTNEIKDELKKLL